MELRARFGAVSADQPGMIRQLGTVDAAVIGVGSMLGAGVFAVWGAAAAAAGNGLILGLGIAAVVAFCNATSSARLAASFPESGGTYVFARYQLSDFWGFSAGWAFVVGKLASCGAIALTVGAYLWPAQQRPVAVLAVILITLVNLGGLSRTARVTRLLLIPTLVALGIAVTAAVFGRLESADTTPLAPPVSPFWPVEADLLGILRAGGLIFFAFAGYARIATLAEEVRDPSVIFKRVVPAALVIVLVVYTIVAIAMLLRLPIADLADADAPLRQVTEIGPWSSLAPVVQLGAGIAALGVLLNLIPGISRTMLAMGRRRDLPAWFAELSPRRSMPLRAELIVAAIVILLVLTVDLRGAIAASGVAILGYYAITNLAALRLDGTWRHSVLAVLGLIGCLVLALALPVQAIVVAAIAMMIGLGGRTMIRRATLR
jgi:APA family basic amino acid/polyamine antiporter